MKNKTQYSCQNCGVVQAKWAGRCASCGEWNTLVEEFATGGARGEATQEVQAARPMEIVSLKDAGEAAELTRMKTGSPELDRVLGGGLVTGSFTLLGGDPGVGKSTLLLQVAEGVTREKGRSVLYCSGEESVEQIRGRAHRLGIPSDRNIFLAAETSLESVLKTTLDRKPDILIIDSLQTFSSSLLESAPGSVSQVREIAARLMNFAKTNGVSVWLVGHVTKDGNIAGPKTVEHMVDTVLYFEGETNASYRLLRAVKNRFGCAMELGVFEMSGTGLQAVLNPSSLFLSDRKASSIGTAICASLEGSRPLLLELQALVAPSPLAMPRRTAVGMDTARISLIAAILDRHLDLSLAQKDLFFNVTGGLRLNEPACDLAAAISIWSSALKVLIPVDWIFLGELGLTGEVRRITQPEPRIEEARKLGFKSVLLPKGSLKKNFSAKDIQIHEISKISEIAGILA